MPAGTVRIRYVALPARAYRVAPGAFVTVPASTDAAHVRYVLRRGDGVVASGLSAARTSGCGRRSGRAATC